MLEQLKLVPFCLNSILSILIWLFCFLFCLVLCKFWTLDHKWLHKFSNVQNFMIAYILAYVYSAVSFSSEAFSLLRNIHLCVVLLFFWIRSYLSFLGYYSFHSCELSHVVYYGTWSLSNFLKRRTICNWDDVNISPIYCLLWHSNCNKSLIIYILSTQFPSSFTHLCLMLNRGLECLFDYVIVWV